MDAAAADRRPGFSQPIEPDPIGILAFPNQRHPNDTDQSGGTAGVDLNLPGIRVEVTSRA